MRRGGRWWRAGRWLDGRSVVGWPASNVRVVGHDPHRQRRTDGGTGGRVRRTRAGVAGRGAPEPEFRSAWTGFRAGCLLVAIDIAVRDGSTPDVRFTSARDVKRAPVVGW